MSATPSSCPDLEARLWSLARPSVRGAPPTLERMRHLLALLDHPEQGLAAVHVGGTSGKGSTCHLLASILNAGGYETGLHSKPHLQSVRERLMRAGRPISCDEFSVLLDRAAALLQQAPDPPPTWFELVVALAFTWFKERQARPAIVEVGLGGTWDATNVLHPLVTVLTSVGLDHTDVLGDTVEAIARDKVGIFKPRTAAISGVDTGPARPIVAAHARRVGAPLWQLGEEIVPRLRSLDRRGARFDLVLPGRTYADLEIGLLGQHQVDNAALAVAASEALGEHGFPVTEAALRTGLSTCRVPGRLEPVAGDPLIILDGAHNPQKMTALAAALRTLYPATRPVCVVAMRRGHDPAATLAALAPVAGALVFTRISANTDWGDEQSLDPAALLEASGRPPGVRLLVESDALRAVDAARDLAGRDGLVCVTGSLYLVGEVRGALAVAS